MPGYEEINPTIPPGEDEWVNPMENFVANNWVPNVYNADPGFGAPVQNWGPLHPRGGPRNAGAASALAQAEADWAARLVADKRANPSPDTPYTPDLSGYKPQRLLTGETVNIGDRRYAR